jgi:hypothetical protein
LKDRINALSKRDFLCFLVFGALFLGWGLSYSGENKKEVTVFYTHAIDGCLEPCG